MHSADITSRPWRIQPRQRVADRRSTLWTPAQIAHANNGARTRGGCIDGWENQRQFYVSWPFRQACIRDCSGIQPVGSDHLAAARCYLATAPEPTLVSAGTLSRCVLRHVYRVASDDLLVVNVRRL